MAHEKKGAAVSYFMSYFSPSDANTGKETLILLGELERVKGIEPSSQAWEARILPLNHTRTTSVCSRWPGAMQQNLPLRSPRRAVEARECRTIVVVPCCFAVPQPGRERLEVVGKRVYAG